MMSNPWQIFVFYNFYISPLFIMWALTYELPSLQVNLPTYLQIKASFYFVGTVRIAGNGYSHEGAAKEQDPFSQETFLQPPKTASETHTYGMD